MRLAYHRLAIQDIRGILDHYENVSGIELANRFFDGLIATIRKATDNPKFFPASEDARRRANLPAFPYHFIFEENLHGIRILIVKHHRRSPEFGGRRK